MMEKGNISKSILSITSPGTNLVPDNIELGRNITRRANEYAADLKRQYPDKFGFWASLPLPDVEGSLAEIDYALDELNADGVAVLTNAHGTYLGDSALDPVFEALDKRNAIVFVHPTSPCNKSGEPAIPVPQYPAPMFEFFFDSARAMINMFMSGAIAKVPNLKIIMSHAGGALPPLIPRFSNFPPALLPQPVNITLNDVKETIKNQFFFDLAGMSFPEQIQGLLPFVDDQQLLYGSDYPFTPEESALAIGTLINNEMGNIFPQEESRQAIYHRNAEKLLGMKSGCPR